MNVPYYLTIEKGLVHFGLEVRKISYICPVLFTPLIGSPYSTVSSLPPSSSDSSTLSSDWEYQHANSTPATSPPLALPPALPQPSLTTAMTESRSLRWDGGPDENMAPGQFLREINIKIEDRNYTTDVKKIDCFRNNIDYGGTA